VSADEVLRWGFLASRAANLVWDHARSLEIGSRTVHLARDAGALEVLAAADNGCGQAAAFGGDFATAALLIAEVDAVKEATGTRIDPYAAMALAALRGQEAAAADLIEGVIRQATGGGQGTAVQYANWARSMLMNGLGRYEEALAAAVEATEQTPELFVATWALSELIEAAARTDNGELARDALGRLGEHTEFVAFLPGRRRPPGAHAATTRTRPHASPLRGMAAPREPPRRRAGPTARGPRTVRDDRHGGVRGAGPGRAAGDG
jgi:hypothetical protein